jgi:hypothetical protein
MSAEEHILITRRSRAVKPRQIAPEHVDLEFARYNRTGTVHVLPYTPGPEDEDFDPVDISWAEAGLLMLEPTIMICGDRFVVNAMDLPSCGVWVDEFADDDICGRCVKTLGDQSPRAFEHPQAPPRRKART